MRGGRVVCTQPPELRISEETIVAYREILNFSLRSDTDGSQYGLSIFASIGNMAKASESVCKRASSFFASVVRKPECERSPLNLLDQWRGQGSALGNHTGPGGL